MTEHRSSADRSRRVIVLPGLRYTPARPLLHFARSVAMAYGWSVHEVWWDPPSATVDWAAWVGAAARETIVEQRADRMVMVGKSLGTHAIPVAAELELEGIWLTPLFDDAAIEDAITKLPAHSLLIGGTSDETWDGAAARATGLPVHEVPDGDHVLEIAGDPVRSADALRSIVVAMDRFFGALEADPADA
jgi:hypothetical protein